MNKRVLVGISGGIDSAVAAYLLKKEGYDVEGATMLVCTNKPQYPTSLGGCYHIMGEEEKDEIKRITNLLGIKHRFIDVQDEYEKNVLSYFKKEYMLGRTPNPCIRCNNTIKFGYFFNYAEEANHYDYYATGHYARIIDENGTPELYEAVDKVKDQSYFLSRINVDFLHRVLFPLGGLTKEEAREIDVKNGFHEVGKSESQDFYGGKYSALFSRPPLPGDIIHIGSGKVIGTHQGYWNYTIGQRKGLGVPWYEPLYVINIDPDNNKVYVGSEKYIYARRLYASSVIWRSSIDQNKEYRIKIRSTSKGELGYIHKNGDDMLFVFNEKIKVAPPGQCAVCYDGEKVVCSGVIEKME